jgi:hypothetical protein
MCIDIICRNVYSENYSNYKLSRFIYRACSESQLSSSGTPTSRLAEGQNLEQATSDNLEWFYAFCLKVYS